MRLLKLKIFEELSLNIISLDIIKYIINDSTSHNLFIIPG